MIRRRPSAAVPRLEVIDWLLLGGPLANDETDPLRSEGSGYDSFLEFTDELDESDLAALWRQHRRALLDEFRRRGLPGEPWGARFDRDGHP